MSHDQAAAKKAMEGLVTSFGPKHLSKAAERFTAKLVPRFDEPYQIVNFI